MATVDLSGVGGADLVFGFLDDEYAIEDVLDVLADDPAKAGEALLTAVLLKGAFEAAFGPLEV